MTEHISPLLGAGNQLHRRVVPNGHIGEKPGEFRALCDQIVDIGLAADHLRVLAGIAAGNTEKQLLFAQQLHRAHHRAVGALAASGIRRLLKAFHADCGHKIFDFQHFLRKRLVDKRGVGKRQEHAVRMHAAQADDILPAHQRLSAGINVHISAHCRALADDIVEGLIA